MTVYEVYDNKKAYMELLLLADEQESMVKYSSCMTTELRLNALLMQEAVCLR